MIVDTHVHVIAADEARYPLHPWGFGTEWFREAPVSVEEYVTLMDDAGVDAAVLVQAVGAYRHDNRYVLAAAGLDRARLAAVCGVDVADDAATGLRELAERDGAAGVRLFAIEPGPRPAPWLDDAATFTVCEAARSLALPVVVTIVPSQLPQLVRLLEAFRDIPVALDHCGFARPAELAALAPFRNLHLKVSSIVLEGTDDPAGLVEELAGGFGAERLLWGSDFPQTHDRAYPELVELAREAATGLDGDDRDAFLGLNAVRLWPSLAVGTA